MTQHVRAGYRRHRKATWALVLALGALIAAIVIPIASGDASKTYTILFPSTSPVAPPPFTTGNGTGAQNLCSGSSYTSVKMTITDTDKTSQLGSADVTYPSNVTVTGASFVSGNVAAATISRTGNVVSLRQLSLPPNVGAAVTYSVTLTTPNTTSGATALSAVVKQSNNFSDSGQNPAANAFTPAPFPTISVQNCTTTIGGNVYLDRNDFTASTGTNGFVDVPKAWTVNLFQKPAGSGSYSTTPFMTTTSDANNGGAYLFDNVPKGFDYKVCTVALGADDSSAWGLFVPSGNTACAKLSSASASPSPGYLLSNVTTAQSGKNFAAVPVTLLAPGGTAQTPDFNYSVTSSSTSGKGSDTSYAQQTWTSGGHIFFEFAVGTCTTNCDQKDYLLEELKGDIAADVGQSSLMYDDSPPYGDSLAPMPYCQNDPRPTGWQPGQALNTNNILPGSATSCIVSGSQTVVKDSSPTKIHVDYLVYTSTDGGRTY